MTVATLWAIFKGIGSAVGIIITLATFWGLISKKPRAALHDMILKGCKEANSELEQDIKSFKDNTDKKLETIDRKIKSSEENDLAILRNTITHIYFKYKDEKRIPHYEKENVMYLYARYQALNGNSYIQNVVQEIKDWEEII